jgi:hypothetical protein
MTFRAPPPDDVSGAQGSAPNAAPRAQASHEAPAAPKKGGGTKIALIVMSIVALAAIGVVVGLLVTR